jgi:phage repressor protein C with HTH and peptisase S24 domain
MIMDISKDGVGNGRPVGKRLLFEAPDSGSDNLQGLVDHGHGPDRNRIIKRPSSVSRETPHKYAIAELCAERQSRAMNQADQRRAAIKRFMTERGLKPAPWAVNAGLSDGIVRNFLAGRAESLNSSTLEKLAQAADATVAELIGEKPREMRLGRDVVAIKSLQVRASMGGGFDVVEEPEGPPFFFRRTWIEKILNGRPGHLRIMEALEGDSMFPTINDGDIALVLLPGEDAKFQTGAIYALWDGQGLIVKRLESMVGETPRLRIISDNKAIYEPYDVAADEVRIIGQILWRGGTL